MIKVCEHCFGEITGAWVSDIPRPGQTDDEMAFWHLDVRECRDAGTMTLAEFQKRYRSSE